MRGWRSRPMSARRPAVPAYMPVAGLGIGMCLPWSLLLGCEVHGAGELVAGDVDVEAGACDVVGLVDFAVRGGHESFRVAAVGHEDSAGTGCACDGAVQVDAGLLAGAAEYGLLAGELAVVGLVAARVGVAVLGAYALEVPVSGHADAGRAAGEDDRGEGGDQHGDDAARQAYGLFAVVWRVVLFVVSFVVLAGGVHDEAFPWCWVAGSRR